MSDATRRDLERRLARDDDLGTRARLLRERARQGRLDPDRLRLAAWVGDPAALAAVEGETPPDPGADPRAWAAGLAGFGPRAWARVVLALARTLRRRLPAGGWTGDVLERLREAVDAALGVLEAGEAGPEPARRAAFDALRAAEGAFWVERFEADPVDPASVRVVTGGLTQLLGLLRYASDVTGPGWTPPGASAVPCARPERVLASLRDAGATAELGAGGVHLVDAGPRKIAVIKEVRYATGLNLREAKELVDRACAPEWALEQALQRVPLPELRAAVRDEVAPWALAERAGPA